MKTLTNRLDKHFVACAAAAAGAAVLGGAEKAQAAIVYSGIQNITIGGTFAGVYLNMITGLTTTSAGTNVGYDINPYYGGNLMFMGGTANNNAVGTGLAATNMAAGQSVAAGPFLTTDNFPDMTNFVANQAGYFGIRFRREGDNALLHGWLRIVKSSANNAPGTIIDWAYNDVAGGDILAGEGIPGPGALAVLAIGAVGLRGRRRQN